MAITESSVVVCPKGAHVNRASEQRQCFYQIKLVRPKQEYKYYMRFLPEVIFLLYAAGKNVVDITLKPFIVRSTCYALFVHNSTVCKNLGQHPETEDIVSPSFLPLHVHFPFFKEVLYKILICSFYVIFLF